MMILCRYITSEEKCRDRRKTFILNEPDMHQLDEPLYKHWQSPQSNDPEKIQTLLKGFLVYDDQRLHIQNIHNKGRKMLW